MRREHCLQAWISKGWNQCREVGSALGWYRQVRLVRNGLVEFRLDAVSTRADLGDIVGLHLLFEKRVGHFDALRLTGRDDLDEQEIRQQQRRKQQISSPPPD